MNTQRRAFRAVAVALAIAAVLGLLHRWGVGLPMLLGLVATFGAVALLVPRLGVRALDAIIQAIRGLIWRKEQGRHHSFAGLTLHVQDIAGQMWIDAESFQRAISKTESEATTIARFAGNWRRDADGLLLLNVQAVAQHLAHMPGREDLRVQRFRRYLERDVLYPASRRNGRYRDLGERAKTQPTAFKDSDLSGR